MAEKLQNTFGGGPFKPESQYINKVQQASAFEAGQILKTKKKIVILTGAGVSAASGIPTFRG